MVNFTVDLNKADMEQIFCRHLFDQINSDNLHNWQKTLHDYVDGVIGTRHSYLQWKKWYIEKNPICINYVELVEDDDDFYNQFQKPSFNNMWENYRDWYYIRGTETVKIPKPCKFITFLCIDKDFITRKGDRNILNIYKKNYKKKK